MLPPKISLSCAHPRFCLNYSKFNDSFTFHKNLYLFDVDCWQLSPGRFQGHLIEFITDNIQIDRHFYNSLMKLEGAPTKSWSFGIPIYPLCCLLFEQKYQLETDYILIAPPQTGFQMVQKSTYGLYVIYLSEDCLSRMCQTYGLPEPQQLFQDGYTHSSAVLCQPEKLKILRKSIEKFFNEGLFSIFAGTERAWLFPFIVNHLINRLAGEIVPQLLYLIAEAKQLQPKKLVLKRTAILSQAEDFMKTYSKANITIDDICQATSVSKRTLEYIFKDFYGTSPKSYLKQIRLNQFRLALKSQADEGAKISDVAREWGFWHSGQLARDYYNLFGELPSQTVR